MGRRASATAGTKQLSIFARAKAKADAPTPMVIAGLFAGIGGFELGLGQSGHQTRMFCEIWEPAQAVLRVHFPGVQLHADICTLRELPSDVSLVTAGFPCQDLSQAGMTAGIRGERSGLVYEVFRLLHGRRVPWVLIENVPFMLQLHRGQAMDVIVSELERLGYQWAYRVVNSNSFGVPQRRERVYLLASTEGDPRNVLLADDEGPPEAPPLERWRDYACGFYWTEGLRGLGWAFDSVPTLKGGSTVGIPSPPGIVRRSGDLVTPDIRDAERMQGFEPDWTAPASEVDRASFRWKLVGNAVTVDAAAWIGRRLLEPGRYDGAEDPLLPPKTAWPRAAWSVTGVRHVSSVSSWPVKVKKGRGLDNFLKYEARPLSSKAAAGFYGRAKTSSLRFPPGFLDLVRRHLGESGRSLSR